MEASVGTLLMSRGWSLAVAESCTGGLVMTRLTDIPGSSRYLVGGVIAYDDRVKKKLLGVDGNLLRRHGAVSGQVAGAMAQGVARALETTMGLAVTGIAGPSGAVPGKPIGTVWFAVTFGEVIHRESMHFDGNRWLVREKAAMHAVKLILHRAREAVARVGGNEENPEPLSG